MIRLLSYIYPITKKVESEFSGTLEITWHNGKKHLNTKNANYSYGSLQTILKIGLQNIDLTNFNKILVLGLGAGSVIDTLLNDLDYKNHITALDFDPVIIDIAKNEFDLFETANLKIICEDAIRFMNQTKDIFDLIIVDLFIDTEVPLTFLNKSFWIDIIRSNSNRGSILFNASLHSKNEQKISEIQSLLAAKEYRTELLKKVNGTNTLLIAKANN